MGKVIRLARKDGIFIEKVVNKDMPYISVITSSRIGPWTTGDNPFCPVTLTPLVFERRENGVYSEVSAPEALSFGLEDIFPDRGMCQEAGQNPSSKQYKVEEELSKLFEENPK